MAAIAYPTVNGSRYSFVSVEAKFNGQIILGLKSINYETTLDPGYLYGTHPDPLGDTVGVASYTASAEFYLGELNNFLQNLGPGFMAIHFDIQVSYETDAEGLVQDLLYGCRIKKIGNPNTQGTDPTTRPVDFSVLKIKQNGLENVPKPLQSPPLASFGITLNI